MASAPYECACPWLPSIRDKDDPNGRMWVTGRTTQLIIEIDPPDLE
ncbi:MAG: hypothetical protein ACYTF9_10165 [Planctomycetota bacterium]